MLMYFDSTLRLHVTVQYATVLTAIIAMYNVFHRWIPERENTYVFRYYSQSRVGRKGVSVTVTGDCVCVSLRSTHEPLLWSHIYYGDSCVRLMQTS